MNIEVFIQNVYATFIGKLKSKLAKIKLRESTLLFKKINNAFLLFSWDVGRPGLWFSLEPVASRDQFYEVSRRSSENGVRGQYLKEYKIISRDTVQSRHAYFKSVYSTKIYHGKILAFGDYNLCIQELKKFEAYTVKYPLTVDEYMVTESSLHLLLHGSQYFSCRSEVINQRVNFEKSYESFLQRSVQQKRPHNSNLIEISRKRQKQN